MTSLLDLIRAYQQSPRLPERMRLAEEVIQVAGPALRAYVERRVPPGCVADTSQEILIAIAQNLHKFKGGTEREFWAWCYRIARNKCADAQRQRPEEEPWDTHALQRLVESTAELEPYAAEERLDLDYAFQLLEGAKPRCRWLLWLRYILDWDYDAIAEATGLAHDAVRMQIGRCLELLRNLLAAHP